MRESMKKENQDANGKEMDVAKRSMMKKLTGHIRRSADKQKNHQYRNGKLGG
jgi:hypothetical protein